MPRRNFQHYIPRFFLNGFSCDGSHIWTFSRRDGLQRRRVENVFGEQHLYSQKTVDRTNRASKSFELTKFEQSVQKDPRPYERDAIGKLESAAAPIVRHLIDQLRHGRIPPMRNTADILTLQRFLYLSARRTPESQIRVFADLYREADRSAFQRIRNSVPYNDEYSFETAEELYCQFPIARRIRDIHRENVAAQFAAGVDRQDDIEGFCANNDMVILHCQDTSRRFIIGSYGYAIVTTIGAQGVGRTAVCPVASDVAIRFVKSENRYGLCRVFPRRVHQTNLAIAELSHTIAGHSKELVLQYKDYVRSVENERFDRIEETPHKDANHLDC